MLFIDKLTDTAGEDCVRINEPMRLHTTFRIGGPADYFVTPATEEVLADVIRLCIQEDVPYFIIGNGSNLLVSDAGFRGVIIRLCKNLDQVDYDICSDRLYVTAGAGILLSRLAHMVCDMGFEGFEFATGIPGTLGGGVTMNAGAYGGEIKDHLLWTDVLTREGRILHLHQPELDLSYRHSRIMTEDLIVLKACFCFPKGDQEAIAGKVQDLSDQRREKQPLEYPSAGSTFKRPEGYFAGKLIQDCGLKGYSVGDAQVSEKHSGFVINKGGACAADVMALIRHVQETVFMEFGVRLETEVRMLGDF